MNQITRDFLRDLVALCDAHGVYFAGDAGVSFMRQIDIPTGNYIDFHVANLDDLRAQLAPPVRGASESIPTKETEMTETLELAKALAEKAKAVSVSNSPYEAKVDYPFALGYLTGIVQDLLLRLSPGQRETIAKQYGLL